MADGKRKTARDRAEATFKQRAIQAEEAPKAAAEYAAAGQATRDKTTRLRAQRLAKETADDEAKVSARGRRKPKGQKTDQSHNE